MKYEEELKQAIKLADTADNIALKYYRSRDLIIETKPDDSPVTQGDKEVEKALSQIVTEEYGDSYVGEEGAHTESGNRRWLVDPIDGTKSFLRGYPVWGSLISLKDGDEVIVAMISAPALDRRWWATKGGGAFTRNIDGEVRRINVSGVKKVSDSFLLNGSFNDFEKVGLDSGPVFSLMRAVYRDRGAGDFFGHMMVAEGAADVSMEVHSALWDIESSTLIVREAGGLMWLSPDNETDIKLRRLAVSSNSLVQDEVLDFLKLK
jgi:histidinol-phosphatase